jgi:hypothetical protein
MVIAGDHRLRYNGPQTRKRGDALSNIQLARLLVTSPSALFAALKEKPLFALPMWLVLIGTAGMIGWYYAIVDIAWLQDQMISSAQVPAAQQEAFKLSRPVLLWTTVIATVIVMFIVVTLGSLYFMLAGAITNVRYSFKHWFAFNWWATSPQILACIPSALILLLTDTNQLDVSALQPLSLNELFFHRTAGQPGYSLLTSFSLLHIVIAWLSVVGVRVWSGRSMSFSLVFALLPTVLIYGIWALFSFR